jgi:tetratricopeptide (TPR) repeat protein
MTPRPHDSRPADDFADAVGAARAGRFVEAIAAVERHVRTREGGEPVLASAAAALGRIARMAEAAQQLGDAERAVRAGLALRPGYPDLQLHRARLCLAGGRREEARRALDEALRLNPNYVAARVDRALLDARDGLIGEALQQLRTLAKESRVAETPAFERGIDRLKEADLEEAAIHLARAWKLDDPALEERFEHFRRLIEEGEAPRAIQRIREALAAYPQYPDLHYLLGAAELKAGRADEALATLARALELHPDFHAARVQMARALHALGQVAEASEELDLVLDADPGYAEARELLERWTRRPAAARALRKGLDPGTSKPSP